MSAQHASPVTATFLAGADLSSHQYKFVKLSAASDSTKGRVILAGAGEAVIGVLMNKPTSGQDATVQVYGIAKVMAGGAITVNSRVAPDANGKAKSAVLGRTDTSDAGAAADPLLGSNVAGIMVGPTTDAVDGAIIEVLLTHSGGVPTTAS